MLLENLFKVFVIVVDAKWNILVVLIFVFIEKFFKKYLDSIFSNNIGNSGWPSRGPISGPGLPGPLCRCLSPGGTLAGPVGPGQALSTTKNLGGTPIITWTSLVLPRPIRRNTRNQPLAINHAQSIMQIERFPGARRPRVEISRTFVRFCHTNYYGVNEWQVKI